MTAPDLDRYSRQMLFSPIGEEGQKKLSGSRAVVLGCGGLGSVSTSILARAGVGNLIICDRDKVELSNLQRQVLFDESDAMDHLPKAIAARRKLKAVNSNIDIKGIVADINPSNIEELIKGADVVVDGTDNFETRFLINDACVKHGIPWVYGAAVSGNGMSMTILPGETPCLRCVFGDAPPPGTIPTCATVGVLGPMVNIIASFQSVEAIKILTGNKATVNRELLSIDIWENRWRRSEIKNTRDSSDCECCVYGRFFYLEEKSGVGS